MQQAGRVYASGPPLNYRKAASRPQNEHDEDEPTDWHRFSKNNGYLELQKRASKLKQKIMERMGNLLSAFAMRRAVQLLTRIRGKSKLG
jgi:hypothetical protein